jgi:flavin-dependent dehydrogenase
MITDARSIPANAELKCDLCIVGAGAAGITLALQFVESTTLRDCLLIEKIRFAVDSPLEGEGFEPSVPRERDLLFKSAH